MTSCRTIVIAISMTMTTNSRKTRIFSHHSKGKQISKRQYNSCALLQQITSRMDAREGEAQHCSLA